ncbi:YnfU family zinc-binding protein [Enterobacter hormaechei]|uniref:YnfU family zinc-binding protein n=1 Tax=Enterobacter hormaechei TaxID=158836 RepID=UPI002AFDDEA6|nr:YnfU family zinc-binding protein [Enterobacter hormaechei]
MPLSTIMTLLELALKKTITFFIYHSASLCDWARYECSRSETTFHFLRALGNKSKQYPALTCMVALLFIQEQPMSGRKNSQLRRNYLVKCSCPNCAKESEHSFTRIQKGAQLVCPYCSALFKSSQRL